MSSSQPAPETVQADHETRSTQPVLSQETDLCQAFIEEANAIEGWTCYPEAAGFDVLVVHEDGRQIGVEAKMTLNAKVADQILPYNYDAFYEAPGPDHRMVIVGKVTDASRGIMTLLEHLGVTVLTPSLARTANDQYKFLFYLKRWLVQSSGIRNYYDPDLLFDWNPIQRCVVPDVVPVVAAGIPSPVKLTPWKQSAIRAIALMRRQGFITAKQIASLGMSATSWTQPVGMKRPWLAKGDVRGQWIETPHMPPFDQQHPEMYELAVSELANNLENFSLT